MKCQYCDGTGEHINDANRMTTCEFCGGTGEFDPNEVDRFNAVDFIKVMEMVKKPLTNEEYIRSCSTEELNTLLCKLIDAGILYDWRNLYNCADSDTTAVGIWLKEKHND